MNTYARIDSGVVAELFETGGDIAEFFNPALVWIEVTELDPQPRVGWTYDEHGFAPGLSEPTLTLADIQASLCVSVDAAADAAYAAIGGNSPGRLAEYQQAKDQADAFKAAAYGGTTPATIACWAQAQDWTAQQACDDIIATASAWIGALVAIRSARLLGKASVNSAATIEAARAAADAAISNVQAIPAGL